jgi:hypothetical protein
MTGNQFTSPHDLWSGTPTRTGRPSNPALALGLPQIPDINTEARDSVPVPLTAKELADRVTMNPALHGGPVLSDLIWPVIGTEPLNIL